MSRGKKDFSVNEAWVELIKKYDIENIVKRKGYFQINSKQIKEYKEPRLMAKWDSSDCLPKVLQDKHLNILPESRSSYVMGDFLLYQEIPELKEHVSKMAHVDLPEYESIDIHHVHSEANAIHVMTLTGILDDFLQVERNVATFSGRMGTGNFDFYVDTFYGGKQNIHVSKAQCEIDGGFENDDSVVIIEAKNVVHRDFHIRQLYYPYRLWKEKVKKPIRLVFSVYSNMIYRLFEYRFDEIEDYSSISLVKSKNYSLQDTTITQEDLLNVRRDTEITENDDKDKRKVSFPQANVMEKVISLMENLYHNPMTKQQIAELMNFDERQSDYYYNAGCYLELFQKAENNDRELTRLGERVFKMNYKNTSALFTGDIEKIAEEKIISYVKEDELKSTIIKVAHHGSKTSSTEKFIEKVKPKIALIGVGENNTFGHPSNITIETLEKAGTKIYRTDKMGEIILKINKKGQIKISNKILTNKSN